jgi:hypothetical protein
MNFKVIIEPVLLQLADALSEVSDNIYKEKSILLNGSTIGGHTRHVIEIFQCLLQGYETGVVNYEQRKRDMQIETNKDFAVALLQDISSKIELPNKSLLLQGFYSNEDDSENCSMQTNFFRELVYNLEHCIHHMALIRVGIKEFSSTVLPDNFGVAPSTIQYRQLCAQ